MDLCPLRERSCYYLESTSEMKKGELKRPWSVRDVPESRNIPAIKGTELVEWTKWRNAGESRQKRAEKGTA
jgi:hypothetical protein